MTICGCDNISKPKRLFFQLVFGACISIGVLATAFSADAEDIAPISLELPVNCQMGAVCSIHKYVDLDPSPARKDYACGRLSKDGDTGTDFRTPSYVEMENGIDVIAAADGVVRATRDGMDDVSVRETGPENIKGREAGNGVVIDHQNNWQTQYSHLKKNSVRVKQGDRVRAGQVLGQIGLSGNTEFPHVEFSVRHAGVAIDPFVGLQSQGELATYGCGGTRAPLWSQKALGQLPYRPSGVLIAGFANAKVDIKIARHGGYNQPSLPSASSALLVWADIFGAEAGDQQTILINGPDGSIIHEHQQILAENNIAWFAYSGKRAPIGGWQPGLYAGSYQLSRDGKIVAERKVSVTLRADNQ